ncbi:MAG: Nif11-like leader peptide family RiPP precursor [Clostridia bacterium]|nr:Nif11-like leader peptide family RiPP precursor [Clostridia bacterium]MBR3764179.1 Nif11-like leader peptide family RiPP precursor [Clostridia bacterium]
MTENMKCFLAKVSEDKALAEKASKLEKDELIVLAKEMGVNLTEADFAQTESDISEGELNSVTGGGNCYCVAGGGGTDGEKDSACACVFAGWGRSTERHERCVCAMAGGGGTDD